jgi:hypothetical protein
MARGFTGGLATGLIVGVIAAALAPLWRPAASRWGRSAAKSAIKQGLDAYETGRGRVAELGEAMEDIVAEAQAERAFDRLQSARAEASGHQPVAEGTAG